MADIVVVGAKTYLVHNGHLKREKILCVRKAGTKVASAQMLHLFSRYGAPFMELYCACVR